MIINDDDLPSPGKFETKHSFEEVLEQVLGLVIENNNTKFHGELR
jgi:hypothetical protein